MSANNNDKTTQRISTPEFIASMSLGQLHAAGDLIRDRIRVVEAEKKRIVWQVCRGGIIDRSFREEQFEAAADHLLSIFRKHFLEIAADFVAGRTGTTREMAQEIPRIEAELVPQFEYETQWFPAKSE
ncbi:MULTISPECIES: hypothetical protein [unclassified Pseudomonas]|uniref:hypothetical protein n=1 Tax=unclassified Pseudomonas TaxID=196821 RepID=UPI000A1DF168|nr:MULTISPECIES: hypothetical protein [unclassified Pseudomonas]